MRNHTPILAACLLGSALIAAAPALAQRGWGGGWGDGPYGDPGYAQSQGPLAHDPREGHVDVQRFVAQGAGGQLGHGPMAVIARPPNEGQQAAPSDPAEDAGPGDAGPGDKAPGDAPPSLIPAPGAFSPREQATYQAAVVDALARAGYDTAQTNPQSGQITEVSLTRAVAVPAQPPHRPVSGEMSMGVSNRGSGMGLALNIDLSKPQKALISTRMSLRIRDRATGAALWEGRAEIITREGSDRWNDNAIADALAKALFAGFPQAR